MYYRVENEIRLKLFFFDEMLNLLIIMEKNSYVQNESRISKTLLFASVLTQYGPQTIAASVSLILSSHSIELT